MYMHNFGSTLIITKVEDLPNGCPVIIDCIYYRFCMWHYGTIFEICLLVKKATCPKSTGQAHPGQSRGHTLRTSQKQTVFWLGVTFGRDKTEKKSKNAEITKSPFCMVMGRRRWMVLGVPVASAFIMVLLRGTPQECTS